ncbi:MAG: GntR family transcriptional regulator, transcriptional repressor for pyruvate dehydrogenase complex [Actinomycetota bacterium]|jgi:DNA-binding FadR family transcriptional regulator
MPLQPVQRTSVAGAVFDQLSDEIVSGRLAPGEALPPERELTERLGVNRQAVREALQRLDQLGLVEIRHGGSTRVLDFRRVGGPELLVLLLLGENGTLDAGVVRSIFELRAAVAADAARLCAARAVPGTVQALEDAADAIAAAPTPLDALGASERFWGLVIEGADNVAYRLLHNSQERIYEPIRDQVASLIADELDDGAGHRRVAVAIAKGQERAAEVAARKVLARGTEAVVAAMAESA